jgi:LytS/YehU family sensor histidine kinase
MWRFVYKPLELFEKNLHTIMIDDAGEQPQRVYVPEFDENFAYFEKLKARIMELMDDIKAREKAKAALELKQLMFKINPHFIHNTLNTLKWYSATKNYPDVGEFISALNLLLMYNMEKEPKTTLQSELNSIDNYMVLQKLKYQIEYTVTLELPEIMLQTETPRFILYPLIENAITHGLEGKGAISLEIGLCDERIRLRLRDSGAPLGDSGIARIYALISDAESPSIGLKFVAQMMKNKFEEQFSFNVYADTHDNVFELLFPYCIGGYYAKSVNC